MKQEKTTAGINEPVRREQQKNNGVSVFHSIKFRIAALICIFVAFSGIINSVYTNSMSKSTLRKNTENALIDLVNAQSKDVDKSIETLNASMSYLNRTANIMVCLDTGYKTGTPSDGHLQETNRQFTKYMGQNPDHIDITLLYPNLIVCTSTSDTINAGDDYSNEAWLQNIIKTEKAGQSSIFHNDEGEALVTLGIPYYSNYNDDGLIGILMTTVKVSSLTSTLSTIKVLNSDKSYATLMDSSGKYIYHPDESKIGTTATEELFTGLIERINANEDIPTTVTIDGDYYVSYRVSPLNNWILTLAIYKDDVMAPVDNMIKSNAIITVIIIFILAVIAYIFANTITNPIKEITQVIKTTAVLDMSPEKGYHKLFNRKDETGEMSRAIHQMRSSFRTMMYQVSLNSENISNSSEHLNSITATVNGNANSNLETAEHLSASMEKSSASTDLIHSDIKNIEQSTSAIQEKAQDGVNLSEEIMSRAKQLKDNTEKASKRTRDMYATVKEETELAIMRSRAVDKINALANNIWEIADQTELLSLNASIEAARAGESGKGFVVVAGEIGKLAKQSASTVENITSIVQELNDSVSSMADSLTKTLNFLDSTVLSDYNDFMKVSEQYSSDAAYVNRTMENISESINVLNQTLVKIATAISEINSAANESAQGVGNVANMNRDIVRLMDDTYQMVQKTTEYTNELKDIVNQFKLN